MKTKSIYVAAFALALMASGCSDDQLVQIQESVADGHQVRVTASMGAQSRLGITDTGMRLEYAWETDDEFHVYDPARNQATTFVMDPTASQQDPAYGTFVGTPQQAYQEGDKLYAVYNKQHGTLNQDADGNVLLDISNQSGQLDEDFQFLFAESTYSENEPTNFFFHHLVTMLKVNVTVPQGVQSVKELLFNTNNSLPTKATLVLNQAANDPYQQFKPGDLVASYDNNDYNWDNNLRIQGNFQPTNGVVTVYLYVFPVKGYWDNEDGYNTPYIEPSVWLKDDANKEYVGTAVFSGKEIEAGKTYQLNTGIQQLEPFANEQIAMAGSANVPYEIATAGQFYTFMLRGTHNLQNSAGMSYNQCHYKLTNNIQLNDEMLWRPVYFSNATFDGQGYTLSGNIQMHAQYHTGLFSELRNNAILQNLNVNLNVTFDADYMNDYFGMFAASSQNSQIINCANHSNVSGKFWYMGGIVGDASWRTSILACSNTGDLSALGNCTYMGGIVANMYSNDTRLEACYNTGQFYVGSVWSSNTLRAGGIAGSMETWDGGIHNCWSRGTLYIEDVFYDDYWIDESEVIFFGGIVGYQYRDEVANCYWSDAVEQGVSYQEEDAVWTDGGTFAGNSPTSEQIQNMNTAIMIHGWQFDAKDGTLKPFNGIITPSIPKEEW